MSTGFENSETYDELSSEKASRSFAEVAAAAVLMERRGKIGRRVLTTALGWTTMDFRQDRSVENATYWRRRGLCLSNLAEHAQLAIEFFLVVDPSFVLPSPNPLFESFYNARATRDLISPAALFVAVSHESPQSMQRPQFAGRPGPHRFTLHPFREACWRNTALYLLTQIPGCVPQSMIDDGSR